MRREQLERTYAAVIRLFPARFRAGYGEAMRQAFCDGLSDPACANQRFVPVAFCDLLTSIGREYMNMLRETYARPALVFNSMVLAGIATVLALALYAIPQQLLRNGANDPQIEMATNLAGYLERSGVAHGLLQGALTGTARGTVDMSRSLSPFLIVYDEQGLALGSNAQLNGQTPVPPGGVFDNVRRHGEERVTWQPAPGVRIAAVIEHVQGHQPGFVLAGRSLREVEARQKQVWQMASLCWVVMLALIAVRAALAGWKTRPVAVAHTA
jgi:hypothetical protein